MKKLLAILASLLFGCSAMAYRQQALYGGGDVALSCVAYGGTGSSSTNTITTNSNNCNVPAGAGVAVLVRYAGVTANLNTFSCADGQTYSPQSVITPGSSQPAVQFFVLANATAASNDNCTATFTASGTFECIFLWVLPNMATSSYLDAQFSNSRTTSGTSLSYTFSTATATEIVLSSAFPSGTILIFTAGGGAILDSPYGQGFPVTTNGGYAGAQHQAFSSIQTSQTQSMSYNRSISGGSIVGIALKGR